MSFTEDLKRGTSPYKDRFLEVFNFLIQYAKNPLEAMRQLPNWEWSTLLIFYTCVAAICGATSGLITLKISQIVSGLIIFPISATIGGFLLSGFFYYTYLFFFKKDLPLKLFFTIIALSMLPYFLIYTLSGIIAPIKLIGFAAAGLLLIVGLSENTHVDKKKVIRLVTAIYIIYLLFWIFNMISFRNETKKYKTLATPESFELLKEEFSD